MIINITCIVCFRSKSNDDTYDWFKGYEYFSAVIRPHMTESDKILMLGCGNSSNKKQS